MTYTRATQVFGAMLTAKTTTRSQSGDHLSPFSTLPFDLFSTFTRFEIFIGYVTI